MSQDCVKRNIVYETRCLSCEDKALENIEALEIDEEERTRKRKEIRQYKYIGESSRSPFERGWEHCNDMAQPHAEACHRHPPWGGHDNHQIWHESYKVLQVQL